MASTYESLDAGSMQPLAHTVNLRVAAVKQDDPSLVLSNLGSPATPHLRTGGPGFGASCGSDRGADPDMYATSSSGKEAMVLASEMRDWNRKLKAVCATTHRDGVNAAWLAECLCPVLQQSVAVIVVSGSMAATACRDLAVGVDATVAYISECAQQAFLIRRSDITTVLLKLLESCIKELEKLQPGGAPSLLSRASSLLSKRMAVSFSGLSGTGTRAALLRTNSGTAAAALAGYTNGPVAAPCPSRLVATLRRVACRLMPCFGQSQFKVMT